MHHGRRLLLLGLLLLLIGGILAACGDEPQGQVEVTRLVEVEVPGQCPEPEAAPECPDVSAPECPACPEPEEPAVAVIPFEQQWVNSPHNAITDEAFVHWNEDDPAEIPTACARCHSTPGFQDYIGADGSAAGSVEVAAPIGTTIECAACHNDVTLTMDSVVFPSGIEVAGLGREARCMQCHQGRHSTVSVNQSIADAGLGEGDDDTVSEDLGFSNIHYYAAAATQYGTITKGGFEYAGKSYDSRFEHVEGYDTCIGCHDPHTLEIRYDECTACHTDLSGPEDLVNVRMAGSLVDFDGDGDLEEGIFFEIEGMRELLFMAMQAYATEVTGVPVVYSGSAYPYFFIDTNADGELADDEAAFPNRYNAWTPRLARAAYNYQVSLKDPGRFAHGGKYIIQLLYDSLEDVNQAIAAPIDMTSLHRIDHGHFAGSEAAFRYFDGAGSVRAPCSKCHSAQGLPLFLAEGGAIISQPTSNGFKCSTCHSNVEEAVIYEVTQVTFPSGATVSFGDSETDLASNVCINCHQGRESTTSVNQLIGALGDDEMSERLRFLNIHYFAAGATLFGGDVQGAYQFSGQEYIGRNDHVNAYNVCVECHGTHTLQVKLNECSECHEEVATLEDVRTLNAEGVDFDGDGTVEGLFGEMETMRDLLYAELQAYAAAQGAPIVYGDGFPYYFNDLNGNGEADADEVNRDNQYRSWTPKLLRGAFNYQYVLKDPGGHAHNGLYLIQVLYDSLQSMGFDVSGMTRPTET